MPEVLTFKEKEKTRSDLGKFQVKNFIPWNLIKYWGSKAPRMHHESYRSRNSGPHYFGVPRYSGSSSRINPQSPIPIVQAPVGIVHTAGST